MAASVMVAIMMLNLSPLTSPGSMKAYPVELKRRRGYAPTVVGA
jgi:hypothetical protein